MTLKLYFHPLSSFSQKVLVALYEMGTSFEPRVVDLGVEASRAELAGLWPLAKIPVLRDDARDRTVPESSVIIEYLARHHPGGTQLVPSDPDLALRTRLLDRFYDLYVQEPMQKVVLDRLRPSGSHDPHGVERARTLLRTALDVVERGTRARTWAVGDAFTMADCAAAPALFYADLVAPLADAHPSAAGYLRRLRERPSFARAVEEARPYLHLFPR